MRLLFKYLSYLRILGIIAFCAITTFINAQNYPFKHYDADSGLPSSDIFHVIQDSKGYIWIATDDGVSRFNGYDFVNYGVSDGLPQNTVLEIFEDYKGRIWFVTVRSQLAYYEKGKIYPYKYNYLLEEKLNKKNIPVKFSFFVDSLDNVYLTIEGREMRVVNAKGNIKTILSDNINKNYNFILEKGDKLLASYKINNSTDTLFYIKDNKQIPIDIRRLPGYYVKHFNAIKLKDEILFMLQNIVYKISSNYKLVNKYKFEHNLFVLQKDKQNNVWVSIKSGGVKCYYNGHLDKTPDLELLKNYYVTSIFEDDRNGYWFSTLHNGVFYLPSLNIKYYDNSNLLLKNDVNLVYVQNDSIWVGYHANYITLITKNKVSHFKCGNNQNMEILKILFDKYTNSIVLGTHQGIYTIKNGKLEKYKINQNGVYISKISAKDIVIDKSGGYWVAYRSGFYYLNKHNLTFDSQKKKNFALRSNAIFVDDDSTIWIGTIKGLWRYKNNYLDYVAKEDSLLSIRVLDIIKFKNQLILGTQGGGLVVLGENGTYQIDTDDGLNSNTITSLAVLGNSLWAGTKHGLSRILIKENGDIDVLNYTKAHGLFTSEIRHVFAQDSFLYISTNKGVMQINVQELKKDTLKIPIYFKEIFINNKKVPLQKEYHLEYDQNNILIKFEALSYDATEEIDFRYMMHGLDSMCSQITTKELRFSFLPSGEYTLELTAKNKDNVWNKNSEQITFIIKKPFWGKVWFNVFIVLLVFVLIYLIIRYKIKRIQNKDEIQRELNIYIKQALVNHMNPHFMYNTLSRVNNLILNNNKEEASEYLSKFSRLMRVVIENSKKEYIPIYEEIKSNRMYLEIEALRMKNKLNYRFVIDDNVEQFKTKVPSLLIHPFIENAIWYGIQPSGKEGELTITIKKAENHLRIEIKDNGIGRKKSIKMIENNEIFNNQSKGTEISYKRVKVLEKIYGKNTKIEYIDLDGDETGTVVVLNLPLIE